MKLTEVIDTRHRPETNFLEIIPETIFNAVPEPFCNQIDLSEKRIIRFLIDLKRSNFDMALQGLIYENIKDVDDAEKCYMLAKIALDSVFSRK